MDDKPNQPKRRGRKPKGGKVIANTSNNIKNLDDNKKSSVIVHIKCTTNNLKNYINEFTYQPTVETVHPYSDLINETKYEKVNDTNSINLDNITNTNTNIITKSNVTQHDEKHADDYNITSNTIEEKLKALTSKLEKIELHDNNDSACFWCTYNFDNTCIHIPKKITDDKIYVYGCFCTPECAMAYLLRELIDDTTKVERIHLINYIYGKIYNYTENIKPALDPHYALKKYFGNLTINEYREIYSIKKKYIIINKPLTLINPELNEDTQQII